MSAFFREASLAETAPAKHSNKKGKTRLKRMILVAPVQVNIYGHLYKANCDIRFAAGPAYLYLAYP
ncbi:MAG: hypothetical protein ABIN99_13005 [Nitrosospira sp.]